MVGHEVSLQILQNYLIFPSISIFHVSDNSDKNIHFLDQAGWGIAWYINNTLIPCIQVERGYTYTFVTYSGMPADENNYHPFYLTDSRIGGRFFLSESQRNVS